MFDNISNSKNEFLDFVSLPLNPEKIFELLYIIQKNERYEIYKAINNESREVYSIKIIPLDDTTFHQKLKEETLIMKSLKKCENTVKYFGSYFCLKTKKIWLIYEYCPAGSIYDLMKVIDQPLKEHQISIIIHDVLKALSFMHQLNIVHNHIKLSNILLNENAVSKLSNFSYANKISINNSLLFSKDNDNSIKKNGDPKYDIFLIGIVCIELFIGIKDNNFDSKKLLDLINSKERYSTLKILDKIFSSRNEQPSENFLDFIKRCIESNPYKRPTAFELKNHPFIKNNINSTNSDKISFSDLVKFNIEKVEYNKKEYNYKELPSIEQRNFSHILSSINSNATKSKISNNKNNENEKNSILQLHNKDNNSYNIDKIAEFRIEQMKRDEEEIELDKFTNKDILVDNSNLDNTGFHYNSVDSRNNTLKQSAAFGKPLLKNTLNNKTYINGKQSLLLSKMMKDDNKEEDSKINTKNIHISNKTNTLSEHSKVLLKKESEDMDFKENWEHLNKYANIFKSDLSDANSNNNQNHSFLFLNVDDSFDIHINNKLIKNNNINLDNTISANNNDTISNHDNNTYNKAYKNTETHVPFTQMKCNVIRLGSSVGKNKINNSPNTVFFLKNTFKFNENNFDDNKEINNQKSLISFGNNALNSLDSNTKRNFSVKKNFKNEISSTSYTSLSIPYPKNKISIDITSEKYKSCKPYFCLMQKKLDDNAFLLINDENKNLKPKKTIKLSLNNFQNNFDQVRNSKRLFLYKYINWNDIPKEKIEDDEKLNIIKVKRIFNNKNLYSSKSSGSLKNSKNYEIKNKNFK